MDRIWLNNLATLLSQIVDDLENYTGRVPDHPVEVQEYIATRAAELRVLQKMIPVDLHANQRDQFGRLPEHYEKGAVGRPLVMPQAQSDLADAEADTDETLARDAIANAKKQSEKQYTAMRRLGGGAAPPNLTAEDEVEDDELMDAVVPEGEGDEDEEDDDDERIPDAAN